MPALETSMFLEEGAMRRKFRTILVSISAAGLGLLTTQIASAQITHQLKADIHHDFTIGNTTLPPGEYVFRVMQDSDNDVMNVRAANGDLSEDFLIRQADSNTVPNHGELIFDRYGHQEFLAKVFAPGKKLGARVIEPSRKEAMLDHQGHHYVEHTESY
jgi:hypothetical protein